MSTVYFLGAGASAADGLPITGALNYGIAHYLTTEGLDSPLGHYYQHAFRVTADQCKADAAAWRVFLKSGKLPEATSELPKIVDTLSVLDVCIAEGSGLGPHTYRPSQAKRKGREIEFELSNALLREVRRELVGAIRLAIVQAVRRVTRRMPTTKRFLATLEADDTIVSTNWDYLLEKQLSLQQRHKDGSWLRRKNVDFGCVAERVTDWRGQDLKRQTSRLRRIYKLHGGVNWYLCDRCQNLYINVEYMPNSHYKLTGDDGGCHCGARLGELIVAPSYLKDYHNAHLRSVWVGAQNALQAANHWVFVGYSLPDDDFHIRALLLRALCVRRYQHRRSSTLITVVTDREKTGAEEFRRLSARYAAFFRSERGHIFGHGFGHFLNEPHKAAAGWPAKDPLKSAALTSRKVRASRS